MPAMACPYSHDRTCQLASQRTSRAAVDSATCFATGIMLQIAANSPSLMRGAWERALKTLCDVYTRMTFIQLDKCVHVFIAFLTSMLHRAATHRFCQVHSNHLLSPSSRARRSWQGTGPTCRQSDRTTSRRRGIPRIERQ